MLISKSEYLRCEFTIKDSEHDKKLRATSRPANLVNNPGRLRSIEIRIRRREKKPTTIQSFDFAFPRVTSNTQVLGSRKTTL